MTDFETIRIDRDERGIARVTLDRPGVRNAINAQMITELTDAFTALNADEAVRAILLAGAGKVFCAGADLNWMRAVADQSREEVTEDSRRLQALYRTLNESPKPTICRVQGGAYAGGVGLVACCDIVLATREARFAVTEVKLGIVPGVISPFLFPKLGASWTRYLAVTGVPVTAPEAQRAGLVHEVADDEAALDERVEQHLGLALAASPEAIAACKSLVSMVLGEQGETLAERTLDANVKARFSSAGQAGMGAFLARKPPPWAEPSGSP